MAQLLFDAISATRRLKDAGFEADQAEAVVQTVTQANSLTLQMVQDLADLKAHVTENMVTKSYLAETLSQYDLKNMATKDDLRGLATKDDLRGLATKEEISGLVTKAEFQKEISGLVTKAEFQKEISGLVTKAEFQKEIRGLVTQAEFQKEISQLVTKAEFEGEFARLYRNLFFGSLGCVSLIIAAIKFL